MYLVASNHAVQHVVDQNNDDRSADQGRSRSDRGCAAPVHADHIREERSGCAKREAEHQDREETARVEQRDEHGEQTDEQHRDLRHSHDFFAVSVFADELLVDVICKYRACAEQVRVRGGHCRGDNTREQKAADKGRHNFRRKDRKSVTSTDAREVVRVELAHIDEGQHDDAEDCRDERVNEVADRGEDCALLCCLLVLGGIETGYRSL